MADWISGTFAVLGTLMVLAGGALIVLRTLGRLGDPTPTPTEPTEPAGGPGRRMLLRRLSPATQLIAWGVVLLVVAALTVGLISFGISLDAGTGLAQ
jgi:hypothetical protein